MQAADVWSLGVCIFLLLTRRLPFWVSSDESELSKVTKLAALIETDEPYFPSFIPESMRSTLQQLLHKHPLYRMTLRQAMRNDWISGMCAQW
jgi:serine/threonine protein kinase